MRYRLATVIVKYDSDALQPVENWLVGVVNRALAREGYAKDDVKAVSAVTHGSSVFTSQY